MNWSCLSLRGLRLPRVFVLSMAFLLPAAAGAADQAEPVDLLGIYVKALDANPGYQGAVAAFHQALEAKPQALAKLLPQISAGGSFDEIEQAISGQYFVGLLNGSGANVRKRDQFYSIGYVVQGSQVLFDWSLFKNYDKAELQVGQAGVQVYEALDELRLAAAQSYFDVLAAQDGVRFAGAEKDAVAQLLEQTRNKFASGLVTDAELKHAQAEYDLSDAALISARNLLDVNLTALELLTGGQSYSKVKSLSDQYQPAPPDPDQLSVWIDKAQAQNLLVQDKHYGTQIAQKEVERVRALRLPTLDANAARDYSYADGGVSRGIAAGNNHELDERAFVTLKIPIFTGGAITSSVRAAVAGFDRAKFEETSAQNLARHGTQVAFLSATAGLSQIKALYQAVQSTIAAEDAARVGYDVGTKTYSDVLLALRARYRAERDYAQARYDYLTNFIKLKQAAGTLSHADILAINHWLQ